MKKKYIIIPLICIIVLVSIIVCVALILNTAYLKRISYDHMNSNVYNGVEVVGDDGLFYLVKDGKKVSKGYVSLQSVNDFYSDSLLDAAINGKSAVLFDYYLARTYEHSDYMLVNSEGEEVIIAGESLSLDAEKTSLPYLVFTDNSNGRKAVISLHRLDSDLSYKSGNELTPRPFKDVTPGGVSEDSALCTYLITSDVTDEPQTSYFGPDGIKITSGNEIYPFELYTKTNSEEYLYLYNADDRKIFSISGELVVSNVTQIFREASTDWRYALCRDEETGKEEIVIFSPQRRLSLSDDEYNLQTLWHMYGCVVIQKADASGINVISISTSRVSTYTSAVPNINVITATAKDGSYRYLNGDGIEILTGEYGDMIPIEHLSGNSCTVFSSVTYDTQAGSRNYHFAAAGKDTYTLNVTDDMVISTVSADYPSFIIRHTTDESAVYTMLSPFSSIKNPTKYNSLSSFSQNGVCWILGTSYDKRSYDIIDPLSSIAVTTLNCSPEDFAKYIFEHTNNIALATDKQDTDTAVHMSVIKLSRYDTDDLMSSARYFVLYRPLPISYAGYESSSLCVMDIGSDLLLDDPMSVYTDKNYLVTHTASGSSVYSLDKETYQLNEVATLPYRVTGILTDAHDTSVDYFTVQNDSGMVGVYNSSAEAVLSPYYSSITHAEDGYFIVGLREAYGVIKVKESGVKTVIDFLYSRILPLGDHGYLATNGEGKTQVYSGSKVVLAEPIQNSDPTVISYTADENGKLSVSRWTLLSADAKLYIHRSEQELDLTFGRYYGCESHTENTVLNRRATVIYYYHGSECIHTDVIYPNDPLTSLYESPEGSGWYLSKTAADQTQTVTINDIAAMNKNIIKLYSKAK